MARRGKTSIHLQDLSEPVQEALLLDLRKMDKFNDIDLNSVVVTGTQKLIEVSTAIPEAADNLRMYLEATPPDDAYVYGKRMLCDVLKISRPTLDRWIKEGIITRPGWTHGCGFSNQFIDLSAISKQLQRNSKNAPRLW